MATGVMGILASLSFAIYALGLRSWTKIDTKTEVMANLQNVQSRISREIRSSQQPSVTLAADSSAVAFLSAGDEGSRQVDAGGRPLWQEFILYYYDPVQDEVYRKNIPYAPLDPTLLDTLDNHTGSPIESHKNGGQPIARNLTKFEASMVGPDMLQLVVEAQAGKEKSELCSVYQLMP